MNDVAKKMLIAAFSVVILSGLIGNSLVIIIIARNKFLRRSKPISIVLLNLALADSTVLLFLAPRHIFFSLIDPHPTGTLGDILCKFITGGNIAWIGAITSICSLLFIASERYYAVCAPHQYSRKFTRKLVRNILVLSWMFGTLFCLPLFFVVRYSKIINFCIEDWGSKVVSQCYAMLWVITAGLVPVTCMVYFYSNVIFALWIKKGAENSGQLVIRQVRQRTRRRVSKALFVISFMYCACWLPPLTNYILVYFETSHGFSNVAYLASIVMVAFNSSVNPVIYAFYSGLFRQHLKNLLFHKLLPKKINALGNALPPLPISATNAMISKEHSPPKLKRMCVLKFTDVLEDNQDHNKLASSDRLSPNDLFNGNTAISAI